MQNNIENTFAGQWIRTIACNLRRVAILCFIVALAAVVWTLTREQRWEATSIAIVPGGASESPLSQFAGIADMAGLGNIGSALGMGSAAGMDVNVVMSVLTSRTVMERIMFKYDLVDYFKAATMDQALVKLGKRINISLTPDGFFIITAEGRSREEAASMVNDIITFTNEELSVIVTSRARRSRIAAEEAVELAQDSLLAAQERMEQFRLETGLIFPEEQGIQSMAVLGTLESELLLAEAEFSGISGSMSSRSTAYIEAARKVDYLRSSMNSRMTSGDSLSLFPGLDSIPAMLKQYENLIIELEVRQLVYFMLIQEVESLRLEEAKDSPTVEILTPAVAEALRSYPKRGVTVIKYTFIAFIICLLWLAVVAYVRRTMESESSGPYWSRIIRESRSQLFLKSRKRKT